MSVWRATANRVALIALVSLASCGTHAGAQQNPWTRPLPDLARGVPAPVAAKAGQPCHGPGGPDPAISPDGRYVLREAHTDGAYSVCFTILTRHGSVVTRRCVNRKAFWALASDAVWMPDSRRWVCLAAGEESLSALMFPLDPRAPILHSDIGVPRGTRGGMDLMPSRLLGTTGPDRMLAFVDTDYNAAARPDPRVYLFEFSVGSRGRMLREITVHLSHGMGLWHAPALSPDGRRLVWLLTRGYGPPAPDAGQPASARRGPVRDRVVLAVSAPDGAGLRPVGLVHPITAWGSQEPWSSYLGWTRDGRSVVLLWRGERWTMRVG